MFYSFPPPLYYLIKCINMTVRVASLFHCRHFPVEIQIFLWKKRRQFDFISFTLFLQVSPQVEYSGTHYLVQNILPRHGIEITFVDGNDIDAYRNAVKSNTKVCLI